jgi:hypothetical protein
MRAGRNRRGFSPRDLEAGPGDKTAPENPGPEWINLGGFLLLRGVLFPAGFDEGGSRIGLAGVLGFGLLGLGWSEYSTTEASRLDSRS